METEMIVIIVGLCLFFGAIIVGVIVAIINRNNGSDYDPYEDYDEDVDEDEDEDEDDEEDDDDWWEEMQRQRDEEDNKHEDKKEDDYPSNSWDDNY